MRSMYAVALFAYICVFYTHPHSYSQVTQDAKVALLKAVLMTTLSTVEILI